jgi:hypothetical protein
MLTITNLTTNTTSRITRIDQEPQEYIKNHKNTTVGARDVRRGKGTTTLLTSYAPPH